MFDSLRLRQHDRVEEKVTHRQPDRQGAGAERHGVQRYCLAAELDTRLKSKRLVTYFNSLCQQALCTVAKLSAAQENPFRS